MLKKTKKAKNYRFRIEYTFNVETRIPPELIFKKGEYTGMRINNIIYEFGQEQGSVSYKITGVVYGKR